MYCGRFCSPRTRRTVEYLEAKRLRDGGRQRPRDSSQQRSQAITEALCHVEFHHLSNSCCRCSHAVACKRRAASQGRPDRARPPMMTFVTIGSPSPWPTIDEGLPYFLAKSGAATVEAERDDGRWSFTVTVRFRDDITPDDLADRFTAAMRAYVGHLRAIPYAQYLDSAAWRATRDDALARGNYTCAGCGQWSPDGSGLQVHHLTYARRGHEMPEDLQVLCRPCHERAHGIGARHGA